MGLRDLQHGDRQAEGKHGGPHRNAVRGGRRVGPGRAREEPGTVGHGDWMTRDVRKQGLRGQGGEGDNGMAQAGARCCGCPQHKSSGYARCCTQTYPAPFLPRIPPFLPRFSPVFPHLPPFHRGSPQLLPRFSRSLTEQHFCTGEAQGTNTHAKWKSKTQLRKNSENWGKLSTPLPPPHTHTRWGCMATPAVAPAVPHSGLHSAHGAVGNRSRCPGSKMRSLSAHQRRGGVGLANAALQRQPSSLHQRGSGPCRRQHHTAPCSARALLKRGHAGTHMGHGGSESWSPVTSRPPAKWLYPKGQGQQQAPHAPAPLHEPSHTTGLAVLRPLFGSTDMGGPENGGNMGVLWRCWRRGGGGEDVQGRRCACTCRAPMHTAW